MKIYQFRPAAGRALRTAFERLTHWHVLPILPRGVSLAHDLRNVYPSLDVRVVFDVGANMGQSAGEYVKAFGAATIYCFEPVKDTCKQLSKRFASESRVKCFPTALGAKRAAGEMVLVGASDQFMLREHFNTSGISDIKTEQVIIETVDGFCEANGIKRIDLLKVDTEGHDLNVLQGAERMLREQRIAFIQAEVGMSPLNTLHVPIEHVKGHLEARGYCLLGIYEQVGEWPPRSSVLRRTNAVFVSDKAVATREHMG